MSLALLTVLSTVGFATAGLNKEQELGKLLYFDRFLSANHNQSCSSCHDQAAGFADPLNMRLPKMFPTSAGSDTTQFGGRNAPPAGYALYSPPFGFDPFEGLYTGGQFWDGRAATLKDQAMGPFLNPVEMFNVSKAEVIAALKNPANPNAPDYQALFAKVYKINLSAIATDTDNDAIVNAYDKLVQAIGEFEKTSFFAPFSSKFDAVMAGAATFTQPEARGWALFNDKAKCNLCHQAPLFTDFTYDNLGIPENQNPIIVENRPDYGLGENATVLEDADFEDAPMFQAVDDDGIPMTDIGGNPVMVVTAEAGKFKVSSLRNLDLTAPYGHNGYFATIEEIVDFYNARGLIVATMDPPPEVSENVNVAELGDLGLNSVEKADLVAFLKTLTDRLDGKSYVPVIP